ncbi:MAG: hypothetical protein QX196_04625, partial [Methylococcaceae bacterium]
RKALFRPTRLSGFLALFQPDFFIFKEYIMLRTVHLNILAKRLPVFVILGLLAPTVAQAFTEDLCFQYVDKQAKSGDVTPKAFNCWNVQCTDSIKPENAPAGCAVKGVARYVNAIIQKGLHGRNLLHFDTVYLYARMQGLTDSDALEAATYSQATDLGAYNHTDQYGKALTALQTDDLSGIIRTNFATSGFALHFVPWLRAEGSQEINHRFTYDKNHQQTPFDKSEALINQTRLWAFGGRSTLCNFGLTKNQDDPMADCFTPQDNQKIFYSIPKIASTPKTRTQAFEGNNPVTGQSILLTNPNTCDFNEPSTCQYAPDYAQTIKGTTKSLGIYMHVLGDRLSHAYCSDNAFITKGWDRKQAKPKAMASDATYSVWYPAQCATISHVAHHYLETGHKKLPEQSKKALEYSYLEIQEWIKATDYLKKHSEQKPAGPNKGYPQLNETAKIAALVGNALKLADAGDRNKALCKIALKGYGITPWHDGSKDCKY